jgi:hypothetical protein
LYKYDGDVPCEFREVRWFETSVFTAAGSVNTWGTEMMSETSSVDVSRQDYQLACRTAELDGFRLGHETMYHPAHFDFAELTTEIRESARRAFSRVRIGHAKRHINAFALLTDSSAMTIGPVAGSVDVSGATSTSEMIWNCSEWDLFEGGAYFDVPYRIILSQHRGLPSQISFSTFQGQMFEACIRALEQLIEEGFFGTSSERENVVVRFQVSDYDEVPGAMARLNVPTVAERFRTWLDSWT